MGDHSACNGGRVAELLTYLENDQLGQRYDRMAYREEIEYPSHVYIASRRAKKFHASRDCLGLRKTKSASEENPQQALMDGKEPCELCLPRAWICTDP